MHSRKCAAFQHRWCRPCWTVRSLEENWQIPKYFLLNWSASAKLRLHNWRSKHWHCAHLEEQRGIARSYLQVAGCGGAARIQLRASAR